MYHCMRLFQFSLVLSVSESSESEGEQLLTLSQKYQSLVYFGNAFYKQTEYRKAVVSEIYICFSYLLHTSIVFI